jgi:hypothetical protein
LKDFLLVLAKNGGSNINSNEAPNLLRRERSSAMIVGNVRKKMDMAEEKRDSKEEEKQQSRRERKR